MFQINNILVYINKSEYHFYIVVNITKHYLIIKEIKKKIDYKLDDNERIYKNVNISLNNDNFIILNNIYHHKRIYLKNIDLNIYEEYNENKIYIESI
jgi:hypothetical protein